MYYVIYVFKKNVEQIYIIKIMVFICLYNLKLNVLNLFDIVKFFFFCICMYLVIRLGNFKILCEVYY